MKDRRQFDLDLPSSLREIVEDELSAGDIEQPEEGLDLDILMRKVYQHIESETLKIYKSNDVWALKAYCYSNILKDVVADEVNQKMVEELMSPVVELQNQGFDPIKYYRDKLENVERKSMNTVRNYMVTACRFVAKVGKKKYYTDADVEKYLSYIGKQINKQSTYVQECMKLLQFLRRLPNPDRPGTADKHRELPIRMPKFDDDFYQPTISYEDIETLAWLCVIDNINPNMVVRLATASIYGCRISELTQISSEDIKLNGNNSSIYIRTKKGGQRKPQPIPQSLVPIFQAPISKVPDYKLRRVLKKICKSAGVVLPHRGGFHSFRRQVATILSDTDNKEINISNFMRWATPRQYSMLARYRQTPVEEGDRAVLSKHPMVALWQQVTPYLIK